MTFSKRRLKTSAAIGACTFLYPCHAAHAVITVNYTVGSALASDPQSALIQGAFQQAANRWVGAFGNTFNFNLTIDFASLGTGILGSTGSTQATYAYTNYRTALVAGATSADDVAAITSLPLTSLPILINRTSDNQMGREAQRLTLIITAARTIPMFA